MASPYFDQSHLLRRLSQLKPELIQEKLAHDPFKLLVAVILLNKTTAKVAIPVFWELIQRWPTPWALSKADQNELSDLLYTLGTYTIRSKRLIDLSLAYLKDPPNKYDPRPSRPTLPSPTKQTSPQKKRIKYPATPVSHLPGTGPYALDSYRIFCTVHDDPLSDEWKTVAPSDKELIRFLKWKWAAEGQMKWCPETGDVQPLTISYLQTLIGELTPRETPSPNTGCIQAT
ncbi:DNA glycosylase [Dendrothele bispora CBS 962.96]|uniref:DNA glycosylase n=1 Tax=Dendrothele bispora (strain CBS 962.96) TaxID=1314807 RepID=A0A4S8LRB5_DENBC|nr:DNA glycosylase [Dendrothele bispora CBS 962.96]